MRDCKESMNRSIKGKEYLRFGWSRVAMFCLATTLRRFTFRGCSTYLEAIVHHIIAPRLKNLQIGLFFKQFMSPVPRLQQFMDTTENLRFDSVKFKFSNMVIDVEAYTHREAEMPSLSINASCLHLDWQVTFATQISSSLSQMFSAVEHLALEHEIHSLSSEEHDEVDRIEWRKLLGSFSNVKTLCITHRLVKELSRCLQLDDGERPLELLPELQELTYSGSGDTSEAFTLFIDYRRGVGRPIILVRRSPSPVPHPSSKA